MALDWLVFVSKMWSQLGPLLSLRVGQPREGQALPSQKGFSRCQNITIYRKYEIFTRRFGLGYVENELLQIHLWGLVDDDFYPFT